MQPSRWKRRRGSAWTRSPHSVERSSRLARCVPESSAAVTVRITAASSIDRLTVRSPFTRSPGATPLAALAGPAVGSPTPVSGSPQLRSDSHLLTQLPAETRDYRSVASQRPPSRRANMTICSTEPERFRFRWPGGRGAVFDCSAPAPPRARWLRAPLVMRDEGLVRRGAARDPEGLVLGVGAGRSVRVHRQLDVVALVGVHEQSGQARCSWSGAMSPVRGG